MLKFQINVKREANGRHKLNAECLGTKELFLAITRCIASRPQANDLKYLLVGCIGVGEVYEYMLIITGYGCCVQDCEGNIVCQMRKTPRSCGDDTHRATKQAGPWDK
jgi:hypothetical protein